MLCPGYDAPPEADALASATSTRDSSAALQLERAADWPTARGPGHADRSRVARRAADHSALAACRPLRLARSFDRPGQGRGRALSRDRDLGNRAVDRQGLLGNTLRIRHESSDQPAANRDSHGADDCACSWRSLSWLRRGSGNRPAARRRPSVTCQGCREGSIERERPRQPAKPAAEGTQQSPAQGRAPRADRAAAVSDLVPSGVRSVGQDRRGPARRAASAMAGSGQAICRDRRGPSRSSRDSGPLASVDIATVAPEAFAGFTAFDKVWVVRVSRPEAFGSAARRT